MRGLVPVSATVMLLVCGVEASVDFGRDVLPILSNNCFECHGPDGATRKAGLRLDTSDGVAEVIEPGNAAASDLIHRVPPADPADIMPPKGEPLTAEEIATLEAWINDGARCGDTSGDTGDTGD